jgi:PAS domain S-box-containing protein
MVTDAEGIIRYVSSSVERVLGYRPEEMVGTNAAEYVHPDDLKKGLDTLSEAVSKPGVHPGAVETRVRHKDGSWRCLEGMANNLLDDPAVEGVVFNHRDVTDRKEAEDEVRRLNENLENLVAERTAQLEVTLAEHKRAEKLVRESEERYRAVVEEAAEGILLVDVDTKRILEANVAYQNLLGYNAEAILGLTLYDVVPYSQEDMDCYVERVLEQRRYVSGERRHRRKDGSLVSVEVSANVISYGGREAISIVVRDITERKQTEEVSSRLAAIVDSSDDAIIGKTLGGIITSWNRGAEKIYGYSWEEATGRPISTLVPADLPDEIPAILKRLSLGEAITHYETVRVTKEGRRLNVSLTISPIRDSQGNIVGASTIARDITSRKEAEDEIRLLNEQLEQRVRQRTAQLEEANKELEAFSYSVSHDLRAPLRHIDGFAQLLQKRATAVLDETGRRYLDMIVESTNHAGDLIDNLLAFSRIGRVEIKHANVDMNWLVREALDDLKQETEGQNISWKVGKLPEVQGDPPTLRIVMANLLSNAVKYTRTRERAEIEVGNKSNGDETVFFVSDNGVGFDMQYVDKLFGVFQRLHSVEEFEGTGIGLATVQRIVNRHGGRAWAEGSVGSGATFYFSLPLIEGRDDDETE